ncbi:replication-associated protein [Crucivirus-205]|nr:replication-associated protein [Crucivirus-204]QMW68710.1 replication-associated protein [Crucivirus-205]
MSRHKNFCFTFNNYENTDLVDNIDCRYIAYGKEVSSTGTPHLQGWISFRNAKTKTAVCKLMPGCHISVMNGSVEQNTAYCSKEGELIERGIKPMSNAKIGEVEIARWQNARELAKLGKFDEIDADIALRCYSTLKTIFKDNQVKPEPVEVKCFWIYGETGTGKSHCVETNFPNCYKKAMDDMKWFCGYNNEEVIYLEDFDIYQVKWGGLLKRLADKWPMQASVKGSMLYIRPKVVIVTSNYRPDQIWRDEQTLQPLERRFKIIEKTSQEQEIEFN